MKNAKQTMLDTWRNRTGLVDSISAKLEAPLVVLLLGDLVPSTGCLKEEWVAKICPVLEKRTKARKT